jgi:hypothetical protein
MKKNPVATIITNINKMIGIFFPILILQTCILH